MLSEKQINALRASFPAEALSADISRGFELTSIKAAFVVERLNEVFGPCGCGWRYVHAPFEMLEGEVLTEVALQFRVSEGGCDPVVWDTQARNWAFAVDSGAWSWPVYSPGGRRPGKGAAPLTDARKGAVTDGLTKAASMIGVGHEVFKGLVRVAQGYQSAPARVHANGASNQSSATDKAPQNGSQRPQQPAGNAPAPEAPKNGAQQPPANGKATEGNGKAPNGNGKTSNGNGATPATPTTFWLKANDYAGKLDRATVSALAKQVMDGKMSWQEAQTRLDDMIDAATLPSFGVGNGKAVGVKVPVATSAKPMAERASNPLDELFE
ncbi:MAG TPA: hypothetical protein VL334_14380 [Anaerolineae bacterium]|nr:hypothetical protein [Anaerolineae bacterium]